MQVLYVSDRKQFKFCNFYFSLYQTLDIIQSFNQFGNRIDRQSVSVRFNGINGCVKWI